METITNSRSSTTPTVGTYLLAGLIAGIVSAVIGNIYNLVYQNVAGHTYDELGLVSITVTAIFTSVVGGLIYYALTRFTKQPQMIFTAVGLVFTTLSVIPNFVSPMNSTAGFAWASTPLHYIVALSAIILIPAVVKARR